MVEKLTLHSLETALVDIPVVSMPIARSLNMISVALCCVIKLHVLEWPFIVPSTRCTCVMIMLFNELLDMPLLWFADVNVVNRVPQDDSGVIALAGISYRQPTQLHFIDGNFNAQRYCDQILRPFVPPSPDVAA